MPTPKLFVAAISCILQDSLGTVCWKRKIVEWLQMTQCFSPSGCCIYFASLKVRAASLTTVSTRFEVVRTNPSASTTRTVNWAKSWFPLKCREQFDLLGCFDVDTGSTSFQFQVIFYLVCTSVSGELVVTVCSLMVWGVSCLACCLDHNTGFQWFVLFLCIYPI